MSQTPPGAPFPPLASEIADVAARGNGNGNGNRNGNGSSKKAGKKKSVAVAAQPRPKAALMHKPSAPRPAALHTLPRSALLGAPLRTARASAM